MKRGQMKLSFGMIFSIILIIIFIAFAFYAISKFLDIGNTAQVARFTNSLQTDIDKVWRGSQASQEQEYFLPSGIEFICFIDYNSDKRGTKDLIYNELEQTYYESENLFFYPLGSAQGLNAKEVKHIDIEKTTEEDNPLCIEKIKGKVKMRLEKDFGEALVSIEK
jgi:hypothetical protein|tara:strand:+ start:99 stop:593 length:495 start_codon:yes stop_codon:yes gene_type:complete